MTRLLALFGLALLALPVAAQKTQHGLRVPDGFVVTEFADSGMANDIYTMTLDPKGNVVVAGRGYIRLLVDDDNNGKADRVIQFAAEPRDGAMGLLWEGDTLYVVGDGALRRYRDANGDGKADGPSEVLRKITTGGEHAAHALRRGPDGWLYLLCGNNSGVDKSFVTSTRSPIRDPVAGVVLRFSPDFKQCEIVAHGFRNPYGMDFNGDGELFTYDSDNERCVSLPWYEPTRFYHVVPGGHYGWRGPQRGDWWRCPPHFIDVVPPLVTLERGSPTGVVCYRHTQFPEKYQEGFFALDWTFGRVWFVGLKPKGPSYEARRELFMESLGDNGFAPTGAAVDPATGDLYISIGGRGTRGAVYRVRYSPGFKDGKPLPPMRRQSLEPQRRPRDVLLYAKSDSIGQLRDLEAIRRHPDKFTAAEIMELLRHGRDEPNCLATQATARLVARLQPEQVNALRVKGGPWEKIVLGLGCVQRQPDLARELAVEAIQDKKANSKTLLGAVRVIQLSLGDLTAPRTRSSLWEGYSPREQPDEKTRKTLLSALRAVFPSQVPRLNLELARTLGMLEDDDAATLRTVTDTLTEDSNPLDDIHYLIVISRLRAARDQKTTAKIAAGLLGLDRKLAMVNKDRHWPMRMRELHTALARKDERLNQAILDHPKFGRPDHALWTRAEGFQRAKAAEQRFNLLDQGTDYPWNAGLIDLLTTLPAEKTRPVLRKLWGEVGLDEVILTELARDPEKRDRELFVRGLASPQLATVRVSLNALKRLPDDRGAATLLALVQALRRLDDSKEEKPLREQIAAYLTHLTGDKEPGGDREAWVNWFRKRHPAEAKALDQADGVDVAAWSKRLAGLNWDRGDVTRGGQVFTKAACATCHSGSQALGPDLLGVTGRFSRDDLFTAILQPSKEVPARYRTTLLATQDDKVYQGIIVYEATDSVIVQTGATTTVRLDNAQVRQKRASLVSLMPTGLLDRLSDQDITDLYAYLRSLTPRQKRRRAR